MKQYNRNAKKFRYGCLEEKKVGWGKNIESHLVVEQGVESRPPPQQGCPGVHVEQ